MILNLLRRLSFTVFITALVGLILAIIHGFPIQEWGFKLKNTKKIVFLLYASFIVFLLAHVHWRERWERFWSAFNSFASRDNSIFLLFGVFSLLFLWQQASEYLAIRINFIPFGFYDYMFYHFWDSGKINYTGLLHGYYHLNTILLFFAPLWKLFSSPLLLVVLYGPLVAAAAIPLYFWIRKLIPDSPVVAWIISFIYLNYRYLDNLLMMNFCVEAFYPLIILSALYFGFVQQWPKYYICIVLGLLIKEDAFIYLTVLGSVFLFNKKTVKHSFATAIISILGVFLLFKWFIPLTGNTILDGSVKNYSMHGGGIQEILLKLISEPMLVIKVLFDDSEKINTYFNLFYRLLFIPVLSPAVALVFGAVFPLFFRVTGRDADFYQLHYQYAAAVIPFVFIALGYGMANLHGFLKKRKLVFIFPIILTGMIFANGSSYRSTVVEKEDIESIKWARKIPDQPNLNFVTHGHLLPYTPYRQYNYYFAYHLENKINPYHKPYASAEYYLIDQHVDPYPVTTDWVENKKSELLRDPRYSLLESDGIRFIFVRKDVLNNEII